MQIYDTNSKSYLKVPETKTIKIYVCGITPYDSAHLGHIFTFLTYDLLQRRLEDDGREVKIVRNITDVDEPIYAKAKQLNTDYVSLANSEITSFQQVLKQLNFRSIYAEPKASEYIEEMSLAVDKLIKDGYGYYVGKDVYFDVAKFKNYGKLSGYSPNLLRSLMSERGGNPDLIGKRNPLDFLLWRHVGDPDDKAQWETVLGVGRPGWHIECSIMSKSLLGETFDIHGGGADLIFPHHESEIAQGFALYNANPARIWMHISPMLMAGEKMSKSLGNMVFAKELLKEYDAPTIRLALMHYHHRIGGEWQNELLSEAGRILTSLKVAAACCRDDTTAKRLLTKVRKALDDDINTTEVIDAINEFIQAIKKTGQPNQAAHKLVIQTLDLLGLNSIT